MPTIQLRFNVNDSITIIRSTILLRFDSIIMPTIRFDYDYHVNDSIQLRLSCQQFDYDYHVNDPITIKIIMSTIQFDSDYQVNDSIFILFFASAHVSYVGQNHAQVFFPH